MAEDEPQDAAAEAFEALRAEVAQVRAALEGLGPVLSGEKGPDYSPTLGAMAKTLEKIESHPALQYTPDRYGSDVRASTEAIRRSFEADGQRALNVIGQASRDISRFAGELRTREQQRTWLIRAGAGGLVAGVVLWVLLSGPIARALPDRWNVPERMAAATLRLNRWDAGQRLLQTASPADWDRVIEISRVGQANRSTLENCREEAVRLNKAQPCTIRVEPPSQVNGTPAGGTRR